MILVFGGNGQLGHELVRTATARGIAVSALSHGQADIADAGAVAAALARVRPDLVVNAAAYTKVDLAETDTAAAALGNETGPAVLAEACASAGVPMLHVSTDYVFDGSKQTAYVATDPVRPINVYGCTKAAGEEAVRRTLKRHVILRTAWVYGEFGANFVKTVLALAATRDELRIVADQYGSPTSAGEIAAAILHVAAGLRRGDDVYGTYHFTAAGTTTWHGFASRIVSVAAPLTGRQPRVTPIRTLDYPTPARRPANSRLDCRAFVETFGLAPRPWTEAADATTRLLAACPRPAEKADSHVA